MLNESLKLFMDIKENNIGIRATAERLFCKIFCAGRKSEITDAAKVSAKTGIFAVAFGYDIQ
jgi:hypothetical protein